MNPAAAGLLGFRLALLGLAIEAASVGLAVALFTAWLGRDGAGQVGWSAGVFCGALAAACLVLELRPSWASCVARLDRKLELGGALELGIEVDAGRRLEAVFARRLDQALEGRLKRSDVTAAGFKLRWQIVAAGLFGAAMMVTSVFGERLAPGEPGANGMAPLGAGAAHLPRGQTRQVDQDRLAIEAARAQVAADEAERGAPAKPMEAREEAEERPEAAPESSINKGEGSKLVSEEPSGVTPDGNGGKIPPANALPPSGAWWAARHDAPVRAWLRSLNAGE